MEYWECEDDREVFPYTRLEKSEGRVIHRSQHTSFLFRPVHVTLKKRRNSFGNILLH